MLSALSFVMSSSIFRRTILGVLWRSRLYSMFCSSRGSPVVSPSKKMSSKNAGRRTEYGICLGKSDFGRQAILPGGLIQVALRSASKRIFRLFCAFLQYLPFSRVLCSVALNLAYYALASLLIIFAYLHFFFLRQKDKNAISLGHPKQTGENIIERKEVKA